jgi:hypothetical protein
MKKEKNNKFKREVLNMLNERVKELLDYLNTLSQVQGSGHYVNEEIKEVIKEVRLELGLEQRKQDTLKESRKLVFLAKLGGKATFRQLTLFEAVFGSMDKYIQVLHLDSEVIEMKEAIEVLLGMSKGIKITQYKNYCVVER